MIEAYVPTDANEFFLNSSCTYFTEAKTQKHRNTKTAYFTEAKTQKHRNTNQPTILFEFDKT